MCYFQSFNYLIIMFTIYRYNKKMINPYNKSVAKRTNAGSIKPTYDLSLSQEEILVRTTDMAVSRRKQNNDKAKLMSEKKPTKIQSSPIAMEVKRARLLTPKVRNTTYKVYDSDGLIIAEDDHLNALLVLWKDTVLLEAADFSNDHILPVIPYSTAHWWDREYITSTASRIATNMSKLREKMILVVSELEHDEWWLTQTTNKMKHKLGDGCELFNAEKTIGNYAGKVALQVFTCKTLANELKMKNANLAVLPLRTRQFMGWSKNSLL